MQEQLAYPTYEELSNRDEQSWARLRASLHISVMYVAPWIDQRLDLIEDIVQEIVMRMFRQIQLHDTNEVIPIRNVKSFCHIMVRNYCRDLWRKEKRVSFFPKDAYAFNAAVEVRDDSLEATLDDDRTCCPLLDDFELDESQWAEESLTEDYVALVDLAESLKRWRVVFDVLVVLESSCRSVLWLLLRWVIEWQRLSWVCRVLKTTFSPFAWWKGMSRTRLGC